MNGIELLVDGFGRVRDGVQRVVDGLTLEQTTFRADPHANTIGWLVWHLTRIQDDHVADAARGEQVWVSDGWYDRFGVPFDTSATGYGQDSDEVAAVRVAAEQLAGYYDAVHERTVAYLRGLTEADLDRVVDDAWTPPVTLAVRLVSVLSDDLQHLGQAALLRGLTERH